MSRNTLLGTGGGSGDKGGKVSNGDDSRVDFLLCPSCFWCASYIPPQMLRTMAAAKDSASIAKCPSCIEGNIESVPVGRKTMLVAVSN